MDNGIKVFVIACITFLTCSIITIGFLLFRNSQESGGKVTEKLDNVNASIMDKDVLSIADEVEKNKGITGEKVLQYIGKYQNDYKIIFKSDSLTTIISKDLPYEASSPNNIDYVDTKKLYNARIEVDENGVPTTLVFWPYGTTMGTSYRNSVYKMFTKSSEITIPDGIHYIKVNACASGKDIYAGEYLLDTVYSVTPGDTLKININYEGPTKATLVSGGVSTDLFNLREGVIGNPESGVSQTTTVTSILGYLAGFDGNDGESLRSKSIYDNSESIGIDACKGGKGGYGGAFGFGGGGGAGAFIDTYTAQASEYSIGTIMSADGGGQDGASDYWTEKEDGTKIPKKTVVVGKGGIGSLGVNRFDTKLDIKLKGGDGGMASLYYGGSGGVPVSFSTANLDKSKLAFIVGASGGGAAGGYGAGGGQGGYGAKDVAQLFDDFNILQDEAICENAGNGSPSGGMVLIELSEVSF